VEQIKLKGTPARGLLGTTIGFFFGFAAVSLYGPTAIKFRESMDLSPALTGLLVAIPSLTGSLLRIPFGAWVDLTGGRKPFLILLCLSAFGLGGITLLLHLHYPDAMHGLYGLVLILGMLSGCGIATFSVGIGQTSYWFPFKKQGIALGTYAGLGNLAPGLFSLVLPFYLQHYGFISAYFAWFLFLVAGIVAFWLVGTNSFYFQLKATGLNDEESRSRARKLGQELFPSGNIRNILTNSAKTANTWRLVILYFTTFGGFIALTAWFPLYWNEFHGYDPVKAGIYTALFSLLASLLRVAGGSIADYAGGARTSIVSLLVMITGCALLVFTHSAGFEIAAIFALAVGMGVNNAAVFKLVPRCVPSAIGGAAGWVGGIGAFGGFVIPPLLGVFVNIFGKAGYSKGFLILLLLAAISLVTVLRMRKEMDNPF
jgi:NNP family nitrate/nitrite transporter-like MFS transporter